MNDDFPKLIIKEMERKKILVIGAGIAGIGCIGNLKMEGLEPVCYEASEVYGGNWYYRPEARYGQASIMPTTVINHSKEMGAASNFPPKKEYSNYMKHMQLFQYITDYMKHFDCERHIYYNMEVLSVKKAADYDQTGRWSATTKNTKTEEVITEVFDGVLVATGHINRPTQPTFPGQDEFKGNIIHTHSLKEVEDFAGQNVAVVGIGCSALDAAVEISRVAKQVYISTRSGAFILNRGSRYGYPTDSLVLRRYLTFFLANIPIWISSWYLETFYIDTVFDKSFYYMKPKHGILSKEPSINDFIGSKFLSGSVVQRGNIVKFTESGVLFDGEDQPTNIDSVIMATGYTYDFPFLGDDIVSEDNGMIKLYECMYPPQLPHPTLAIIGFFNPYGPGFPLGELQIRWAIHLLQGKCKLPSEETMMKEILKRHKANLKRYGPGEKSSVRLDFVEYMDEIANKIGVKPNLVKYLITDFRLYLKLILGPCVPYQYRLQGPGKWDGAREAIMTVDERIQWPLRRNLPEKLGFCRVLQDYVMSFLPFNTHMFG